MNLQPKKLTENDLNHLQQCLDLAEAALEAGDEPFGSILVNQQNQVIATARNRVNELNVLAHPEIELANWAANHLSEQQRKNTTMYTSGEHCPMCAAAQAWVGLGTIVYLSAAEQLLSWLKEFGVADAPLQFIPVEAIIKNAVVRGPAEGQMIMAIKKLHERYHSAK